MHVGLIILDGWGLNPDPRARDAVAAAETPTFDRYREAGADSTLETYGRAVGLPEKQMGNSEVGHLTIGAGRILTQESARIGDAVENGTLGEVDAIAGAVEHAREHRGRLHVLGLVSDGGVHSYQKHVHALLDVAAERDVPAVTHAFTDGRDTSPKGGEEYLRRLEDHVAAVGTGDVATVSGRYYAMDRDRNWERTRRAYDAMVERGVPSDRREPADRASGSERSERHAGHEGDRREPADRASGSERSERHASRKGDYIAPSAVDAVLDSYARGETDEFVEPTLVEGGAAIEDGDAAIFANFRADRARQLTRMLGDIEPGAWGGDTDPPELHLVTMTEYDAAFDLPVAFPPRQPEDTLGSTLADTGHTQLRIAETEKYAHVTYFLNGGREVEFPGEIREIVESPDVPTYDQLPEMSAKGVTDTAIEVVERDDPDVMVLNYANPDMVGHTGDFDAAVAAVEAVDEQLGRLVAAVQAAGGHALICADHGNADDMGTPEEPHTAHTLNPVPFVYLAPDGTDGGRSARDGRSLADVAPTVLALVGVDRPDVMTGTSLLK